MVKTLLSARKWVRRAGALVVDRVSCAEAMDNVASKTATAWMRNGFRMCAAVLLRAARIVHRGIRRSSSPGVAESRPTVAALRTGTARDPAHHAQLFLKFLVQFLQILSASQQIRARCLLRCHAQ